MQHEHAVGRQNQIDFRAPAPDFDRLFERSDGILGRSLGFPISPMRDDLGLGLGLQRSDRTESYRGQKQFTDFHFNYIFNELDLYPSRTKNKRMAPPVSSMFS